MFVVSAADEDRCCRCGRVQIDMVADDSPWEPLCAVCCDALVVCRVVRLLRAFDLGPALVDVAPGVLRFLPSRLSGHRMYVLRTFLDGEPWTASPFLELDRAYLDVLHEPALVRRGRMYFPGYRRFDCSENLTTYVLSFLHPGRALSSQLLRCECRGRPTRCARCSLL